MIRHARLLLLMLVLFSTSHAKEQSKITTLEPGVIKIAVTSITATDPLDTRRWMFRYAERLGKELKLTIEWQVVPFNKSWELAGKDVVDLVATNVASFPDRISAGGTFSKPFLYERRALRIHAEDKGHYTTIDDFIGKKVGAVTGMAAERDLLRRAPDGVNIVTTNSFTELYELFDNRQVDAIAKAEYYTIRDKVIPSHGPEYVLIDHHDLYPGQREESVFIVRDKSTNLLHAVNQFVEQTPFPLHIKH